MNARRRNGLSIAYHKPSAGSALRRSESHQDLKYSQESHSVMLAINMIVLLSSFFVKYEFFSISWIPVTVSYFSDNRFTQH